MEVDLKIINCYIVTVDNNNTIYEDGCLIIDNKKIYEIGDETISYKYEAKQIIDAQGCVVMPGLVNAHNHAAMTIYRGMADDLPLQEWLNNHIFPTEAKFTTKETVEIGTRLGIIEMLRSGTTTFADMYYFEDTVATICKEYGIRGVLSQAILDFEAPDFKTPLESLHFTENMIQKYQNDEYIKFIPGPHSPYTCSEDTLKNAGIWQINIILLFLFIYQKHGLSTKKPYKRITKHQYNIYIQSDF
jgi:5-methylthioadenosine/S-adenosylhomocysteine deaminase